MKTNSTETKENSAVRNWQFPSSMSEVSHIEWNLKEILIHMHLMSNDLNRRIQLKIDILQFHEPYEDFSMNKNDEDKDTDQALRAFEHGTPTGSLLTHKDEYVSFSSSQDQ